MEEEGDADEDPVADSESPDVAVPVAPEPEPEAEPELAPRDPEAAAELDALVVETMKVEELSAITVKLLVATVPLPPTAKAVVPWNPAGTSATAGWLVTTAGWLVTAVATLVSTAGIPFAQSAPVQ